MDIVAGLKFNEKKNMKYFKEKTTCPEFNLYTRSRRYRSKYFVR